MAGCATSQTGYVQHHVANAACLLPKHQAMQLHGLPLSELHGQPILAIAVICSCIYTQQNTAMSITPFCNGHASA